MCEVIGDGLEIDEAPPAPSAMIESMRAIGYSPAAAIADLIDNSITAHASNVWLRFEWSAGNSWVTVRDDGHGMTAADLVEAMRLGGRSPLEQRDSRDLGRFSMGLKTASFSQCRRLTVASRTADSQTAVRRWDLDYLSRPGINGWHLLRTAETGSLPKLQSLETAGHGTVVLWEQLDRLVSPDAGSDPHAHDRFLRAVEEVRLHLAMVFHRYIGGARPSLRIYVNGEDEEHRIVPWDPFLEDHPATWSTPPEPLPLPHGKVLVQGFVLPHKDRLDAALHKEAAGPRGWNDHQGFYVYRNRRLLLAGCWLGLGSPRSWTKEEHYKLARIRIDIPNTMDGDWQIDVKKSFAKPPAGIRRRLRSLADDVRRKAREVYAHRGSYGPRPRREQVSRVWIPATRQQLRHYRVDRSHPLVKAATGASRDGGAALQALLSLIEETVPVQQIWLDSAEQPNGTAQPFQMVADSEVRRTVEQCLSALLDEGRSLESAADFLRSMDAFREHQGIIEALLEKRGCRSGS